MNEAHTDDARYRRVEDKAGTGSVRCHGETYQNVHYEISRYQGMTTAGLPVPGVHRIEGRIHFSADEAQSTLSGSDMVLTLEDGATLNLTLLDSDGRIVAEGHGPSRCNCC